MGGEHRRMRAPPLNGLDAALGAVRHEPVAEAGARVGGRDHVDVAVAVTGRQQAQQRLGRRCSASLRRVAVNQGRAATCWAWTAAGAGPILGRS